MAEGDITLYNNVKEQFLLGTIDLSSDTMYVSLHGAGYTPDVEADVSWGDVSGTEIPVYSSYVAGGLGISGSAVSQNLTTGKWDALDVTWASLNLSGTAPDYGIIRDNTASDILFGYIELGVTVTNGGDYTLQWHANGILLAI